MERVHIIILAWGILEPDRGGSDREWNATRVAREPVCSGTRQMGNARVAGSDGDGVGGYRTGQQLERQAQGVINLLC